MVAKRYETVYNTNRNLEKISKRLLNLLCIKICHIYFGG